MADLAGHRGAVGGVDTVAPGRVDGVPHHGRDRGAGGQASVSRVCGERKDLKLDKRRLKPNQNRQGWRPTPPEEERHDLCCGVTRSSLRQEQRVHSTTPISIYLHYPMKKKWKNVMGA